MNSYIYISGIKVPIEQKRFQNKEIHSVACPICREILEVEETKFNEGDTFHIVRDKTISHIRDAHRIHPTCA